MRIYSVGFHTSYQYALAYCFPDIEWTFEGIWSKNRPLLPNVRLSREHALSEYDFFLAHSPLQYSQLACELEEQGIPRERIIYIAHWALQPDIWYHVYDGVSYDQFLKDLSNSAIVCVSHFMTHQFRFFSNVCLQAIPHYVPEHLFNELMWRPGNHYYINVVNNFYAPNRGVGADFWNGIDFVKKKLYGASNRETDCGALDTVADFKRAVSEAAAYLWTANAVAISFAPLEAMLLGCPVIAPRNLDWPMLFNDRVNILLYEEENYDSCKSAVEYLELSPQVAYDISCRGRDAVITMYSAELFRERWSRVLDAAAAASQRGRRRLELEASAPVSPFTLLRESAAKDSGYSLVTNISVCQKDTLIAHPARTWINPRQFLHKYKKLEAFSPVTCELMQNSCGDGKTVFVIGDKFDLYAMLAARLGAKVLCSDFHKFSRGCIELTAELNGLPELQFTDAAFDDNERTMWASNFCRQRSQDKLNNADSHEIRAVKLDDHLVQVGAPQIDLMVVDDIGFETRILKGAFNTLQSSKPELIINCYRHVAFANGAPISELIGLLYSLGYELRYTLWTETVTTLKGLEDKKTPDLDHFVLHASPKHAADWIHTAIGLSRRIWA